MKRVFEKLKHQHLIILFTILAQAIEDHFDVSCELNRRLKQKNDNNLLEQVKNLSSMADIHYIRQKDQKGLGDAILHAEKHCDDEPFAVLLGDTITVSSRPVLRR